MYERMLNKQIKPNAHDFITYCGQMGTFFQSLNSFLSDQYKTTQEIRFPYGNNYGWCITHRKGKKLICDIFAEADAFTIMLRLSDEQYQETYETLQPNTKQLIDQRYPCGNGGWIHYRVATNEDVSDIETLLSIKCR